MSEARAYYNEHHPGKAAALRELIRAGLIAPGDVDDRSILDVRATDLVGYRQCHFFAGIGIWSYALRLAGWPDYRPVWTGSAPCQPFSVAGKREVFADARHLAPAWLDLIHQCAPDNLFGEQVAGAVREGWLDALQDEMEAGGYACGAATFPACGIGAPHIRQRLYFGAVRVADADSARPQGRDRVPECAAEQPAWAGGLADGLADSQDERHEWIGDARGRGLGPSDVCGTGRLADAYQQGSGRRGIQRPGQGNGAGAGAARERSSGLCADGGLVDADGQRCDGFDALLRGEASGWDAGAFAQAAGSGADSWPGPTNGFWRDADWLHCRDGKWRPVEPGTSPLAHGSAARVLRLHSYGDGIVAQQAAAFIADFDAACRDALGRAA